jgi:hypothetical protein
MDVSHIFPLCCCNFLHTTTSTSTISAGRVPDARPPNPPITRKRKKRSGAGGGGAGAERCLPPKGCQVFCAVYRGLSVQVLPLVLVNYISLSLDWQALVLPSVLWLVSCMMTSSLKSLKAPVIDN